jgi:hypothetical protein
MVCMELRKHYEYCATWDGGKCDCAKDRSDTEDCQAVSETVESGESERQKRVKEIAELMRASAFPTTISLKFDAAGEQLLEGHHRLHALIESGVTLEFPIELCEE